MLLEFLRCRLAWGCRYVGVAVMDSTTVGANGCRSWPIEPVNNKATEAKSMRAYLNFCGQRQDRYNSSLLAMWFPKSMTSHQYWHFWVAHMTSSTWPSPITSDFSFFAWFTGPTSSLDLEDFVLWIRHGLNSHWSGCFDGSIRKRIKIAFE
jgi:hypothetical protein